MVGAQPPWRRNGVLGGHRLSTLYDREVIGGDLGSDFRRAEVSLSVAENIIGAKFAGLLKTVIHQQVTPH